MNPILLILKAIDRIVFKERPVLYHKQKEDGQIIYIADEEIEGDIESIKALCGIAIADFEYHLKKENKP